LFEASAKEIWADCSSELLRAGFLLKGDKAPPFQQIFSE